MAIHPLLVWDSGWLVVESVGWSEYRVPGLLCGVADRILIWLPALGHRIGEVPATSPEDRLLVSRRGAQHQRPGGEVTTDRVRDVARQERDSARLQLVALLANPDGHVSV